MSAATLPELLDRLEEFHGPQQANWPTEPYEFLVWWNCGYPASDAACERGWQALKKTVGVDPAQILAASQSKIAGALKGSGMFPELRAERIQQVAHRVVNELAGDLRGMLRGPVQGARKLLKTFHSIADPGADRILLFAGIAPVAAVPSNCVQVLTRIDLPDEPENYGAAYRHGQRAITKALPEQFAPRMRAYLLIKQHGQTVCRRSRPNCIECPLKAYCVRGLKSSAS